ncbi:MAG: hypothetical protein ACI9OJ_005568 [Myxococcota bacterium]
MFTRNFTALIILVLVGCQADDSDLQNSCDQATDAPHWQVLSFCRDNQLLAVWSKSGDTWVVGAAGEILRFDGCEWSPLASGTNADLWWVFGVDDAVFIGGANGTLFKWTADTGLVTQSLSNGESATIYGIWGHAKNDVWAVGFDPKTPKSGVVYRYAGDQWTPVALPTPGDPFKVFGTSENELLIVGRDDLVLKWDQTLTPIDTGLNADWVTVSSVGGELIAVGGPNQATLSSEPSGWKNLAPDNLGALQGICGNTSGQGVATGISATFLRRSESGTWSEDTSAPFALFTPGNAPTATCSQPAPDYHACHMDDSGHTFVVGGNFLRLTEGALLYYGSTLSTSGL